jgi:dienelactone hydrolase
MVSYIISLKRLLIVSLSFFLYNVVLEGQVQQDKPVVDSFAIKNWSFISSPGISKNGDLVVYITNKADSSVLTVKTSFSDKIKKNINDVKSYKLSNDGQFLIVLKRNDSLQIVSIFGKKNVFLPKIKSFKYFKNSGKEWIVYHTIKDELVFYDIASSKSRIFTEINFYYANNLANSIVVLSKYDSVDKLSVIDLGDFSSRLIGSFPNIENLILDKKGIHIAFRSVSNDHATNFIFYCNIIDSSLKRISINTLDNIDRAINLKRFSYDGKFIFLNLKKSNIVSDKNKQVKIWNFSDSWLRSDNSKENVVQFNFGILNLVTEEIHELQSEYDNVEFISNTDDKFLRITSSEGNLSEQHWNKTSLYHFFLYNLSNQTRIRINFMPISLSPNGYTIIGFDSSYQNILSYNVKTSEVTQISPTSSSFSKFGENSLYDRQSWEIAGWITSYKLLLYDKYDIWLVDIRKPNQKNNLTNFYGFKNNISFRFVGDAEGYILSAEDTLLITAFDNTNKKNGFFKLGHMDKSDPIKLIMSNHIYKHTLNPSLSRFKPLKAENINVWLIQRTRSDSSTNYYLTSDFIHYRPITNNYPEKAVNWLTSELINYPGLNGINNQGILYKPENFDSTKKYPLIINYYDKRSDLLNWYIEPGFSFDNINIPYFVSRGYLVFTPDIVFIQSGPGPSAVNSIVGAAVFFQQKRWVDSSAIGIQGHSFGGYLTNYIVSHSRIFAAAISSSGFSNLFSSVGSITLQSGIDYFDEWAETQQGRIQSTLWKNRDIYINNSPVFYADQVTTPLLIVNNQLDGVVNFDQGLEYFLALRKLKKKAWMLQYPGEGHGLIDDNNIIDYTLKMESFFDHYLKKKDYPKWMVI